MLQTTSTERYILTQFQTFLQQTAGTTELFSPTNVEAQNFGLLVGFRELGDRSFFLLVLLSALFGKTLSCHLVTALVFAFLLQVAVVLSLASFKNEGAQLPGGAAGASGREPAAHSAHSSEVTSTTSKGSAIFTSGPYDNANFDFRTVSTHAQIATIACFFFLTLKIFFVDLAKADNGWGLCGGGSTTGNYGNESAAGFVEEDEFEEDEDAVDVVYLDASGQIAHNAGEMYRNAAQQDEDYYSDAGATPRNSNSRASVGSSRDIETGEADGLLSAGRGDEQARLASQSSAASSGRSHEYTTSTPSTRSSSPATEPPAHMLVQQRKASFTGCGTRGWGSSSYNYRGTTNFYTTAFAKNALPTHQKYQQLVQQQYQSTGSFMECFEQGSYVFALTTLLFLLHLEDRGQQLLSERIEEEFLVGEVRSWQLLTIGTSVLLLSRFLAVCAGFVLQWMLTRRAVMVLCILAFAGFVLSEGCTAAAENLESNSIGHAERTRRGSSLSFGTAFRAGRSALQTTPSSSGAF
ncbi:unnamed protein product [Amoebophrya sp. A120]|nr:unnamed protein product [Amoebophrya sp. A120]|eukprot:GSA120T00017054001.1